MALSNTKFSYGSVSKFLHWLIFLLVTTMIIYGFVLEDFPKSWQSMGYNIHKLLGLLVLVLMLCRITWALLNPKPQTRKQTKRFVSVFMHYFLYFLLIAMPLSGWLMTASSGKLPHLLGITFYLPVPISTATAEIFEKIHASLAWIIILMVSLHALSALKHHFIDKDDVLKRMWPYALNNTEKTGDLQK